LVVALKTTFDATVAVPSFKVKLLMLAAVVGRPVTASLNVAVSGVRAVVVPKPTLVAPGAGLVPVTVGLGPVMKFQLVAATDPPDTLLMAVVSERV
jgi:hypothetical protein